MAKEFVVSFRKLDLLIEMMACSESEENAQQCNTIECFGESLMFS